ncbi:MAG: phosphotransferase enzyme family protein [Bacillota bacterium]
MTQQIAVSHSIVHPSELSTVINEGYTLPSSANCELLAPGMNDTYQVVSGDRTYIYRVYRAGWRSTQDIQYELDLLLHLHQYGIPVSAPIPKSDGAYISKLMSPEGMRIGVLFTYAPGDVLGYQPDGALKYGALAAKLHNALDLFQTETPRFALDLEHLLENPLHKLRPFAEKQGSWGFLSQMGERLRTEILAQEGLLEKGVCHGDLHGHNVHLDEHGRLVLFDFDCGGPGWRAYDLAVYRWAVDLHAKSREPWDAFVKGYRSERSIQPVDMDLVPVFVAVRTVWLLGLQTDLVSLRGVRYVESVIQGGTRALEKWDPALLR